MPKWYVTGADKESGEARYLRVVAADERSAQKKAIEIGVLVASVVRWDPKHHTVSREPRLGNPTARPGLWQTWTGIAAVCVALLLIAISHQDLRSYGEKLAESYGSGNHYVFDAALAMRLYTLAAALIVSGSVMVATGSIVRMFERRET